MSFQFALVRNGNTAVPGITNFDKIGIKVYPRDFVLLSIDNNNINGTEKINGITFNEYRFKIHGTKQVAQLPIIKNIKTLKRHLSICLQRDLLVY